MKQRTRLFFAVLAASIVTCAIGAFAAEPETITIRGSTYSIVPDEEMRALGFELPDVAPEENAATDYLKAIEAYWPKDRREPLLELRDEVIKNGWTAESAPLAEYLEHNEKTLEWLRAAASKNVCHFPILVPEGSSLDETSPAGIPLPYLVYFRELARFLATAGKFHEFEGRTAEALDAYLLALRLGGHAAQDPILVNGIAGIACDQVAIRPIEQCLIRHEIDDETLAKAHRRLAALAPRRPKAIVSLRGERAFSTSMVEHLIEHPAWLREYAEALAASEHVKGDQWQGAVAMMLATEEGREQIRADVRAFWDAMDEALAMPLPEFIETGAGDEPMRTAGARVMPPNIMSMLGGGLVGARISFARNNLSWTVLDVEFALARYAAEHGAYPEELDEVKDLMLSGGIDPFSGKPLHYRLEREGGFTIWSVGQDLKDDGGEATLVRKHWGGPDYVWTSRLPSDAE